MTDSLNAWHPQITPQPLQIRQLYGTQPGLLDPTQPARLLRLSGSRLSFASFDPLTASAQVSPDLGKLNLNTELYRPKRVVIETAPTGESTWRFVPSAKRDEGVMDEGSWPRVVNLCGQSINMTQDQWDIYKLDPLYVCNVHIYPHTTTIQYVGSDHSRPLSPKPTRKRPPSSRSPPPIREMPPPGTSKTAFIESDSESDEFDEVEEMITNGRPAHSSTRNKEKLKRVREERRVRREKLHRRMGWPHYHDNLNSHYHLHGPDTAILPERSATLGPKKRKADSEESTLLDAIEREETRAHSTNYYVPNRAKRARTADNIRLDSQVLNQEETVEQLDTGNAGRVWHSLDQIIEEVAGVGPQPFPSFSSSGTQHVESSDKSHSPPEAPAHSNQEEILDEEALHSAALEESRRKMAELERDRPLWEEAARKRRQREAEQEAEQEALRAKLEAQRREEAKQKAEAEEKTRKAREQEEQRKREEQERIRKEKERREQERKQRQQRWATGLWTTQRALERYRVLCETFDNTKYSSEHRLMIDDVPWPVLSHPSRISVEDVTWDAVEKFFGAVRPHMRHQDYKIFVEKSHRRFHPDRWKSRGLLRTVEDEAVRGCMEVAANTVAQALTPLWRSLTSR